MNRQELDAYLSEIDKEIAMNAKSLQESKQRLTEIEESVKEKDEFFSKFGALVDLAEKNGFLTADAKKPEAVEHLAEFSGLNSALKKGIVSTTSSIKKTSRRSFKRFRV